MQTAIIEHNLEAMFANRQLKITGDKKSKAAEKLSSGYKINRSADDAAGLAISEKMRWQIKGLDKATTNTTDGISALQVGDGALGEVQEMLHRMTELSVQAANDTNTPEDRQQIQKEINQLLTEVDRIGDTTEFNTKPLFKGAEEELYDTTTGGAVSLQNVPFSAFTMSDVNLTGQPFTASSSAGTFNLAVAIDSTQYTTESGQTARMNLVYGSGATSHPDFRYSYTDADGVTHSGSQRLENMQIVPGSYSDTVMGNGQHRYSRTFSYAPEDGVSFELRQLVTYEPNNGTSQYAQVQYQIKNTGTETVDYQLMENIDTAYNNNDRCEEYYMNNQKVNRFSFYTEDADILAAGNSNVYDLNTHSEALNFSIYNAQNDRLPFSEFISTAAADSVLFGRWGSGFSWDSYDALKSGATNVGGGIGSTTTNADKMFSLIYSGTVAAGDRERHIYLYGVMDADQDSNVNNVPVDPSSSPSEKVHVPRADWWIQSGATQGNGMFIGFEEMNTGVLGIRGLDVTTHLSASDAIEQSQAALDKVSEHRSYLGAQQNRLEHTVAIDKNTSENTSAAESRLRDTDMADAMVDFSKHSILEQAGQSMLSQANQSKDSIMQLLG